MDRGLRLFLSMVLLGALASAPAAAAQSRSAATRAVVLRPLSLVKTADLDFGSLAVTGAGTAVISIGGALTTTGGVTRIGGTPQPASFTGAAGSPGAVKVTIPTGPITLTRVGGTETMRVDTWTTTGGPPGQLSRNASFSFKVGATLRVAAGQAEGTYVGSFNVTVDYR